MENILRSIFEYQRFENNAALSSLICRSEERFERELRECDLELICAAGEIPGPADRR